MMAQYELYHNVIMKMNNFSRILIYPNVHRCVQCTLTQRYVYNNVKNFEKQKLCDYNSQIIHRFVN